MFLMRKYTILGILLGGADNMGHYETLEFLKVEFAGGANIKGKKRAFKVVSQISSLVS